MHVVITLDGAFAFKRQSKVRGLSDLEMSFKD